nr:hypothetical protein HJG63_009529 [Rousettus aegyptiacus]
MRLRARPRRPGGGGMRLRARPRRPGRGGKRTRRPPGPPSGPGREFQPFPATPADTLRLANKLLRMQSEHFSNHALVLAPERVRPHATPFTGVSQIPTAPLVFTARQFRASSLWFRSLVCGARCGARTPLSSGRSSRLARSFWIVGHQAGRGGFWQDHVSASPISTWPLFPSLWRSRSAGFRFFFSRTGSTCSLRAGVSREVATSGPSHAAISDHTHQG